MDLWGAQQTMIDAWEADLEVDPLWRMACQALKSAQAETLTISSEEDRLGKLVE